MTELPDDHRTILESRSTALRALASSPVATVTAWLDRVDPGTNRRIKGLRLVTAFGLAWLMGTRGGHPRPPRPEFAWRHGRRLGTLGQRGDSSTAMLVSRGWETLIGGAIGLATALLLFPIRAPRRPYTSGTS